MIHSLSKVSTALRLPGAARRELSKWPGEDARPGRRPAPEANIPPRLDRGRGAIPDLPGGGLENPAVSSGSCRWPAALGLPAARSGGRRAQYESCASREQPKSRSFRGGRRPEICVYPPAGAEKFIIDGIFQGKQCDWRRVKPRTLALFHGYHFEVSRFFQHPGDKQC